MSSGDDDVEKPEERISSKNLNKYKAYYGNKKTVNNLGGYSNLALIEVDSAMESDKNTP